MYFVPDGEGGFRAATLWEWAGWNEIHRLAPFPEGGKVVGREELPGNVVVSTVFLGLNHNYHGGEPILFETMVFGGPHDDYQRRYRTHQEAQQGHAEALRMVKGE
jgi:hypothetical protein